MAQTQNFIPKMLWDETLLHEGKYGEWFWSSLSISAKSWVKHAQCQLCGQTPHYTHCTCHKDNKKPANWVNRDGLLWQLQAACRGADVENFMPANVAVFNQPDAPWRKYCVGCPVSAPCSLYGEASHSEGVFGGLLYGTKHTMFSKKPEGSGKRGRPRKVAG